MIQWYLKCTVFSKNRGRKSTHCPTNDIWHGFIVELKYKYNLERSDHIPNQRRDWNKINNQRRRRVTRMCQFLKWKGLSGSANRHEPSDEWNWAMQKNKKGGELKSTVSLIPTQPSVQYSVWVNLCQTVIHCSISWFMYTVASKTNVLCRH